jgi:hypothetical protein
LFWDNRQRNQHGQSENVQKVTLGQPAAMADKIGLKEVIKAKGNSLEGFFEQ